MTYDIEQADGGYGAALAAGRVCATAGEGARGMISWARRYPGLYGDANAFDATLFDTLSLASAFSGPALPAADLRMANLLALWAFALDKAIDRDASTRAEVDAVAARCLAAAKGDAPAPGDELAHALAGLRDELAAAPAYSRLAPVWLEDLERMLQGMAREWDWASASAQGRSAYPTVAEYLANADNLGFSFVLTAHWITGGGEGDVERVREASAAVQRVIRVLNDLGTYERDVRTNDLNVLLLDEDREQVQQRLAALTGEARGLIGRMREDEPVLGAYMERQMDFCAGFYGGADFWGHH
ncbi:terpene synthase family protein [Actinomadura macrotermitis]|uniref:terpene synthase family protein n=1 Tax=Actinomadura macrotermitis TaxID=2585200 RepID=UPI00188683CF|nr:terpene synthase family protein [Actinomadura macrotermitis]